MAFIWMPSPKSHAVMGGVFQIWLDLTCVILGLRRPHLGCESANRLTAWMENEGGGKGCCHCCRLFADAAATVALDVDAGADADADVGANTLMLAHRFAAPHLCDAFSHAVLLWTQLTLG